MDIKKISLSDKYTVGQGRIFLTGTQALVRLNLMQRQRDVKAGLNTAGYVSGYRGSPLGGVDKEFTNARAFLTDHHIRFHPAVNEDLAATALWGTQQVNMYPGARYDGVFGMWYGKGPGVDRSGDAFRHANFAGTSPHGGVLVLAGDDPACKSSTVPSQSEHALMDVNIPILNPIDVQEVLDFGLHGWAMSRYSGCWVGMKCITDNIDTSASVIADPDRVQVILPDDFTMPDGGLHIRWPDSPLDQELRLQKYKIYAALAFARANRLDRITMDSPTPRFGIVATGKSYLDTLQALDDLGIDQAQAEHIGLRLYKVGMPWPLEREGIRHFAEGLDEILIVEEKRAVIENQLKEQLYNWRADVRPRVVGKFDEKGEWILPSAGELTPARIARVIADRIHNFHDSESIRNRLKFLEDKERAIGQHNSKIKRVPYFCSGCPHNTSTRVPEGSRAMAGIGCHYMVTWMDRSTSTFTHMGAEGVPWIGQSPFTEQDHVFVNLGDGTYYHSGIMAIRASVAAGVNITYKILYNDAVAMTGGQPMDGPLDVPAISRQTRAEGATQVVVVSDEPEKYSSTADFATGVEIYHRDELDVVQRQLRTVKGVSILIYDQTCAAEKRRRRKRGTFPDPARRIFINQDVCEGCGDCGIKSNCVSITPVETDLGRKREIDQSSCNKDYSCINGFCPSFVTVSNAEPRKREALQEVPFDALPEPTLPSCDKPYEIVITGVGGTGIVTASAGIAISAHMEGKGVTALDIAGLAQKNGAVYSHIRIANDPDKLHAVRISAGGADLLLGCDMITAGDAETLGKLRHGRARAVVNSHEIMTADFTSQPDLDFPAGSLQQALVDAVGQDKVEFIDATAITTALLGTTMVANTFLLGYAYQRGYLPLSRDAIEQSIRLNGTQVDLNLRAFLWGRRAAHNLTSVKKIIAPAPEKPADNRTFVAQRVDDLTAYQNAAYGRRFADLVARVAAAESSQAPGKDGLSDSVARSAYKLMAYKDEYEVARLYSDGRFEKAISQQFRDGGKLTFHLAPPLLAKRDADGHLRKRTYGAWIMHAFRLLTRLKGLRGTLFDPFGYSEERRTERRLIDEFEQIVDQLLQGLTSSNHGLAMEIAALPLGIRGFGHIKEKNIREVQTRLADMLARFQDGDGAAGQQAAE